MSSSKNEDAAELAASNASFLVAAIQQAVTLLTYHPKFGVDVDIRYAINRNPDFDPETKQKPTPLIPYKRKGLPPRYVLIAQKSIRHNIPVVDIEKIIGENDRSIVGIIGAAVHVIKNRSALLQLEDNYISTPLLWNNISTTLTALSTLFKEPNPDRQNISTLKYDTKTTSLKEHHFSMLHKDNLFEHTFEKAWGKTITPTLTEMSSWVELSSEYNQGHIQINSINSMNDGNNNMDFTSKRSNTRILYSACHRFIFQKAAQVLSAINYITEFQYWNEKKQCVGFGFNILVHDLIITLYREFTPTTFSMAYNFDPYKLAMDVTQFLIADVDPNTGIKCVYDPCITSGYVDEIQAEEFRISYRSYFSGNKNDVNYTSACVSFFYDIGQDSTTSQPKILHTFSNDLQLYHNPVVIRSVTIPRKDVPETSSISDDPFSFRETQLATKKKSTEEDDWRLAKELHEKELEEAEYERLQKINREQDELDYERRQNAKREQEERDRLLALRLEEETRDQYNYSNDDQDMPEPRNVDDFGEENDENFSPSESSSSSSSSGSTHTTEEDTNRSYERESVLYADARISDNKIDKCNDKKLKKLMENLNSLWMEKMDNASKNPGSNFLKKGLSKLTQIEYNTSSINLWSLLNEIIASIINTIDFTQSYKNRDWSDVVLMKLNAGQKSDLKRNVQFLREKIVEARKEVDDELQKYNTEMLKCESLFLRQYTAIVYFFIITPLKNIQ